MRNVKNENKPRRSKGKATIIPPPKGNRSLSGSLIQMCLLFNRKRVVRVCGSLTGSFPLGYMLRTLFPGTK